MDCMKKTVANNNIFTHEPTSSETVLTVRKKLPEYISGSRLAHTLSVEEQALDMAKKIFPYAGIDEKYLSDVKVAALLHDITKHASLDEQLRLCEEFGHNTEDPTERSCSVLHAFTGAYLSKKLFNVNKYVFDAVYSHTLGNDNMNILDKIIFLADYIEPTRKAPSCQSVHKMFYDLFAEKDVDAVNSLNFCIIKSIDLTLAYLAEQGSFIHVQTVRTRNSVLAECATFVQQRILP